MPCPLWYLTTIFGFCGIEMDTLYFSILNLTSYILYIHPLLKIIRIILIRNNFLINYFVQLTTQTDYSFGSIFMPMNGHNCTRK